MDIFNDVLAWILSDFALAMMLLSVLLILFHLVLRRNISFYEIVYRWVALFALGFSSLYAGVMHVLFPVTSASLIGWANSPFQLEVGVADIALGLLGVFSFNASHGFRLAAVIAATVMFWGDAAGHINQMIINENFAPGNAGTWFWLDIIVPLILILCFIKLRPARV